jgi:creatinine amidohydrolase
MHPARSRHVINGGADAYRPHLITLEAGMSEILLERMTSPAVRAAIDGGRTTVIIACGAVEQHGPHLPLFMDAEHGAALSVEVAQRLGDALVAPTIRVGCSEHHMAFAGTLSLRVETFQAVCEDYARSLARHGFRDICFLPTHGGNYAPLAEALERLDAAAGPDAAVHAFTDLDALIGLWRRVVEEEAGLGERVGGHADIAEGSIMLALHPELVREGDAVAGYTGAMTPELRSRMFEKGFAAVTPNGILGDARGASAAIGRRLIDEMAEMVAGYFSECTNRSPAG